MIKSTGLNVTKYAQIWKIGQMAFGLQSQKRLFNANNNIHSVHLTKPMYGYFCCIKSAFKWFNLAKYSQICLNWPNDVNLTSFNVINCRIWSFTKSNSYSNFKVKLANKFILCENPLSQIQNMIKFVKIGQMTLFWRHFSVISNKIWLSTSRR